MHGRVRVKTTAEKEKEQREAEKEKIRQYSTLKDKVWQKYQSNVLDQGALEMTALLLGTNSELSTMWNYRRSILLEMETNKAKEEMQLQYKAELKLVEDLLQKHHKSYWIWFHREWVTERMTSCDWNRELDLCTLLLKSDARNFHCWSYRRYVVKKAGISAESEFEFTTTKIEHDFSNYSAWHQRSVLIPKIYPPDNQEYRSVLDNEFELIQNAFYTEPADQSAWIYHRWLTTQVCLHLPKDQQNEILEREMKMCTELQHLLEKDNDQSLQKWPIFTIVFIMQKMGGDKVVVKQNLDLLTNIDPTHQNHYLDLKNSIH